MGHSSAVIGRVPLDELAPPKGMVLHDALLATYDPPDAEVLLDVWLPVWLGVERSKGASDSSQRYLAERADRLRSLGGRIAVFHSQGRLPEHPWLWAGHAKAFAVGGGVKQHAKLWLLHWRSTGGRRAKKGAEKLDVVISSMNLTHSALRDQVQAVWRCRLDLEPKSLRSRTKSWGMLGNFLEAMAKKVERNSIEDSKEVVGRFKNLLGRADPPGDVHFIASIPGLGEALPQKQIQSVLGRQASREVDVLAPFIGSWRGDGLSLWQRDLAGKEGIVRVLWRDKDADSCRWSLDPCVARRSGLDHVRVFPEPGEGNKRKLLFDGHPVDDGRSNHSKVYGFATRGRGRRKRHTLITSANFTPAAWGLAPNTPPKNFELGVLVPGDAFGCDVSSLPQEALPAVQSLSKVSEEGAISATWDGKCLRTLISKTSPYAAFKNKRFAALTDTGKRASVGLKDAWRLDSPRGRPVRIEFTDAKDSGIPVVWIGDALGPDVEPLPDPEIPEELRLELEADAIAERYGGPWLDGPPEPTKRRNGSKNSGLECDYGVPAIGLNRSLGVVVDSWARALSDSSGVGRELVLLDGKRLCVLWGRIEKVQRNYQDAKGLVVAYRTMALELKERVADASDQ